MHSSTVVLLRALVMLGCLVTIPMAAVLGTSLPDVARSLMDGRLALLATSEGSTVDPTCQFEPMPVSEATLLFADEGEPSSGPHASVLSAGLTSPHGYEPYSGHAATQVQQASYEVPQAMGSSGIATPAGLVDVGAIDSWANPPSTGATHTADPFAVLQQRLRKAGATYYLLESWGDRQQLFRCYCRVAIGGNPAHTRHFEATDAEPLAAMSEVLRQIEVWRGAWVE